MHPVKQTHDPGFMPAAAVKLPWFQIRSPIHHRLSVCLCLSPKAPLPPARRPQPCLHFHSACRRGPAARATKAQVNVEVDVGAGAGGAGRGCRGTYLAHVLEDPLHRSDPPPPSSYLVIFCCHSCTAPSSTVQHRAVPWLLLPPVHRSSPCIFISNRSRLHHPSTVSLSCLPVPASPFHNLLASRLLSSRFLFLFFSLISFSLS